MVEWVIHSFLLVYICTGVVVALVLTQVWIRIQYARKVKAAGGIHAPCLAETPLTALSWLWAIGRAQTQDRLLILFKSIYKYATPEYPNLVEINVFGGRRYFFTQEPEHIKTLLMAKFAEYGKGQTFHDGWEPFLGDSIFTTDGWRWRDSRDLIRPMFTKSRVSDLDIFDRWTTIMINQFPQAGQKFNISALFYRLTIDIITEFLLGESINSLENPLSEFAAAFTEVQRMQILITVLFPINQLIPRGRYLHGIRVMERYIMPFIEKTLLLNPDDLEKISTKDANFTFLHALARYTQDSKIIRDQIMAILLAGRDTTAATLSWCLHEMSYKPAVYAKLRAEVLEVIGTDARPTYETLKSMKYLSHVINETLRLYPAVPFNVRFAVSDTTLPSCSPEVPDVSVVNGDAIIYSTMAMQHRADLYPADQPAADDFCPERWDTWQPKPWQYIPFNGGPRICVGQNFALTEMAFVLSRIAQKFESLDNGGSPKQEMDHKFEIVGTPGKPVEVILCTHVY